MVVLVCQKLTCICVRVRYANAGKDLEKADRLLRREFAALFPTKSYAECIEVVSALSDELKAWAEGKLWFNPVRSRLDMFVISTLSLDYLR